MDDKTSGACLTAPGSHASHHAPSDHGPTGFDPSRDREFRQKICAAANRIAAAELFSGPVDHGQSFAEFLDNVRVKERIKDQALGAIIEVVLHAKVHGDAIIAARNSDTRRMAETGTGSVRSTGSAGRKALPANHHSSEQSS